MPLHWIFITRGSISVQLVSCLTGLDSVVSIHTNSNISLVRSNLIQINWRQPALWYFPLRWVFSGQWYELEMYKPQVRIQSKVFLVYAKYLLIFFLHFKWYMMSDSLMDWRQIFGNPGTFIIYIICPLFGNPGSLIMDILFPLFGNTGTLIIDILCAVSTSTIIMTKLP